MLAARHGHADMIKLLLQSEAPIKAKDKVSKRFFIRTCVYVCVCVSVLFIHCAV